MDAFFIELYDIFPYKFISN